MNNHNCPWKDAIIEMHILNFTLRKEHEDNPELAVSELIQFECELALDPRVSEQAADLQQKAQCALWDEFIACLANTGIDVTKIHTPAELIAAVREDARAGLY